MSENYEAVKALLDQWAKENSNTSKKKKKTNESEVDADVSASTGVVDEQVNPEAHKRSRSFCCITYIDEERVCQFLKGAQWVQHYAVATHNEDLWTETDEKKDPKHKAGTKKEKHTHIILYTFNAKTSSAIKKLFDKYSLSLYGAEGKQNTSVQLCYDASAQYRYLIHADDPEKHQYSPDIRLTDEAVYWSTLDKTEGLNDSKNNVGLAMVQDYIDGVPYRTMCERYGQNFIFHAKYIIDMASLIEMQETSMRVAPINDDIIKVLLKSSGDFNDNLIQWFFEMLHFLEKSFKQTYNASPDFNLYLGGGKND